MTKTAFIAIVGKPNVGKSSILNKILGQKIAIVSSKPQTTRTKIMGVLTEDETQLVFTDTPGFHIAHNKLGEKMNATVGDTVGGVDACLFIVEPKGKLNEQELQLIEMFKKQKCPVILAINKIDTVADKKELLERIVEINSMFDFTAVVPVSATEGDHVDELVDELKKLAFESPHFFPDDTLTDQPERVLAAEIIREKILLNYDKEIPYSVEVEVEEFKEDEKRINIMAVIYVERSSQKGIIIGNQGEALKKVGIQSRLDIEAFFGKKVFLNLYVKVLKDWRNKDNELKNFGYANK